MRVISEEEFIREANERFGENAMSWKVICPVCGTIQSPQDFFAAGVDYNTMTESFGCSCVGRFTGAGPFQKGSE